MVNQTDMGAKLGISGVLEFRDAQGNLLKTVQMTGSIPLSDVGLTTEQAQTLIDSQEQSNGTDHRQ